MPPKGKGADKGAKKAVLPPFYAFGKLNKNGQISDKKGAAALARASVAAGRVLGRLVPVRAARREFAARRELALTCSPDLPARIQRPRQVE